MKHSLIALTALLLMGSSYMLQGGPPSLPFPVKVGGQEATAGATDPIAKLAKPIPADAELEVVIAEDVPMIIINAFPANDQGAAEEGATPVVIMAQNSKRVKLNATMDKKPLPSGYYLLNIVAAGKTSRLLIQIE